MSFSDYLFGLRGHDVANDFENMCINAKKHGVKNLQFALAKTVTDVDFDSVGYDKELSLKIKDALVKNDLKVSVLGCYINPVETNEDSLKLMLKRFENFIYYAKDFGACVIGTETGSRGSIESTRSEENYKFFVENLKPLVKIAEEANVTIGIEPVWQFTVYSAEVMKRVLDEINSPNLGVIFDLSNIMTADRVAQQDDIINEAFDLLGDKIKAVHVKDFVFEGEQKHFAVTGEGQMNLKLLFERIGMLSKKPEIILDESPLSTYERALENLKKILN